jgi:hypothetical protein
MNRLLIGIAVGAAALCSLTEQTSFAIPNCGQPGKPPCPPRCPDGREPPCTTNGGGAGHPAPSGPVPPECDLNGGPAGLTDTNSFPLYVISTHHGSRPGSPPPDGLDLRTAAVKFSRIVTPTENTLIAFPASPGGGISDGYLFPSSTYFVNQVNSDTKSKPSLNPVLAGTYGASGNSAAATGKNWSVTQIQELNYPKNISGGEGKDYGVFSLTHKPSGLQIVIIAATLENGNPPLEASQIQYLLNAAIPYKDQYPTFIAADLNFDADDPNAAKVTPLASWINREQKCTNVNYMAFSAGNSSIINLMLVDGLAASRVVPRVIRFDPDKAGKPNVPDPTAGYIELSQGGAGLGGNHPALAITFGILPPGPVCRPPMVAKTVCWKDGDPKPAWVPRCHTVCVKK